MTGAASTKVSQIGVVIGMWPERIKKCLLFGSTELARLEHPHKSLPVCEIPDCWVSNPLGSFLSLMEEGRTKQSLVMLRACRHVNAAACIKYADHVYVDAYDAFTCVNAGTLCMYSLAYLHSYVKHIIETTSATDPAHQLASPRLAASCPCPGC